jgi:hypothetical protein
MYPKKKKKKVYLRGRWWDLLDSTSFPLLRRVVLLPEVSRGKKKEIFIYKKGEYPPAHISTPDTPTVLPPPPPPKKLVNSFFFFFPVSKRTGKATTKIN